MRWKKGKRVVLGKGGVLFAGFLLLMFLEIQRYFTVIDPIITEYVQRLIPRFLDIPLSFFSLLGSSEVTSLILLFFAWLLYQRTKKLPLALLLFGFIFVFEIIGKLFVFHPGPPSIFFRYNLPFVFPTAYVRTDYSFPSGHVSRTIYLLVVGVFLAWRYLGNRQQKTAALALAILTAFIMAVSRIYLGEHWTSDVFGGVFLGASLGTISVAFF